MGTRRKSNPVARLLDALEAEEIRFILIGMSAAVVQGVMETTLDVDLWVDLPARQYMRVQNIARKTGAVMGANTVAFLEDGTPMNFVFEVNGLDSFSREYRRTEQLEFYGKHVSVLKLERILKSKETIRRDKDLPHIIHIRNLLRCRRGLAKARTAKAHKRHSR
jgi:hypothetical protein